MPDLILEVPPSGKGNFRKGQTDFLIKAARGRKTADCSIAGTKPGSAGSFNTSIHCERKRGGGRETS